MPKLIFTSRYLKDAPASRLENYVRYISTRKGVEKIDESKLHLPATQNQKQLIAQLVRDIPDAKEMLEYADYRGNTTRGNASEFITCVLEQNVDRIGTRKNYVDYIANRPRVERIGEHGLFTDAGSAVVLSKVQREAAEHKGVVWTHVISLRREDAARLGYDSAAQWMALLRSKRAMLCKHMKIQSEDLRWYAAFHNEGHHPHVHLLVYSAKDHDGYLTKSSIEAMRSELAHDIFRQDFAHIYEEQNHARENLKTGTETVLKELIRSLQTETLTSAVIEAKLLRLSKRLENTGGKKVYGYLKKDVKLLVDQIVDELERDSRVAALYQTWGKWQKEILLTYQNETPELPPLSRQPQFKRIKNMVIAEALNLSGHHFFVPDLPEEKPWQISEPEPESEMDADPLSSSERNYGRRESTSSYRGDQSWWTDNYKLARTCLFGSEDVKPDFQKARNLFLKEARTGNAFAMHDLGRMVAGGLGCEMDAEAAQEWYAKALDAFQKRERTVHEKQRPYLQYRIGKMYAAGLGTEQDYEKAAGWFSKAVEAGHKYARYSLAGLYYRGQGVIQDYRRAFRLYGLSSGQGNPYASYELAKMYRDGIGTETNQEQAQESFRLAFFGFQSMEKESHDDKLQYRLGQMLHTGTGVEQNDERAMKYWEASARLGNVHAQYSLGRLRLEKEIGDPAEAVAWIIKAAESGNTAARYTLAKLYLAGEHVPQDIPKAIEGFSMLAEQENEFAAYQLGKIYLSEEYCFQDVQAAIRWLRVSCERENQYAQYTLGKLYLAGEDTRRDMPQALELFEKSAAQGNQYAQYTLGKLYLVGKEVPRDREKAAAYLQAAAAQGNIYAQFFLDHPEYYGDPSVLLSATRLMRRIGELFREDYQNQAGGSGHSIDRKRRRKLQEKKRAQGHARDDREPQL